MDVRAEQVQKLRERLAAGEFTRKEAFRLLMGAADSLNQWCVMQLGQVERGEPITNQAQMEVEANLAASIVAMFVGSGEFKEG
jgi:hypothetical protein